MNNAESRHAGERVPVVGRCFSHGFSYIVTRQTDIHHMTYVALQLLSIILFLFVVPTLPM
jgi:hypothetical protein